MRSRAGCMERVCDGMVGRWTRERGCVGWKRGWWGFDALLGMGYVWVERWIFLCMYFGRKWDSRRKYQGANCYIFDRIEV